MKTILRYTTRSGSIYEVMTDTTMPELFYARRLKLGEHHVERGPAQVAKRNADKLDEWRACPDGYQQFGKGLPLIMRFGGDDILVTSPVLSMEREVLA